MSFIADIQKKPRVTRQMYAFFGALLATFLVFAVWASTVPARFAYLGDIFGSAETELVTDIEETTLRVEMVAPVEEPEGLLVRAKRRLTATYVSVASVVSTQFRPRTESVVTEVPEQEEKVWSKSLSASSRKEEGVPVLIATSTASTTGGQATSTTETVLQ